MVDVEGGDAPAFGDHSYDDDDKNSKKRSSGVMGSMSAVGMGAMSSMSSGMGAASFGRVFQSGDSAPDARFFIDLRDKLLMVRCLAMRIVSMPSLPASVHANDACPYNRPAVSAS